MAETRRYTPLRFISEPIEVTFVEPPLYEKKPGFPSSFTWRDESYDVIDEISEWQDITRKGAMASNMREGHLQTAERQGSWGVGRTFFRVGTREGRVFDLYYDRAPSAGGGRKGGWFLFKEMRLLDPQQRDG